MKGCSERACVECRGEIACGRLLGLRGAGVVDAMRPGSVWVQGGSARYSAGCPYGKGNDGE
jgi:hypothetical protein